MPLTPTSPLDRVVPALLVALASFGAWAALAGGYGSDLDTYLVLRTFRRLVVDGEYVPSRFTGYPLAELVLGSLAWWGGPAATNLATFAAFGAGLVCFVRAVRPSADRGTVLAFLLLASSNHVLFFDAVQANDYAWAFLPFAAGAFLLSRGSATWGAVLLGVSVGFRPNFAVFVATLLLLTDVPGAAVGGRGRRGRLALLAIAGTVGAMYYVPVWVLHDFGFGWVSAERPPASLVWLRRAVFRSVLAVGTTSVLFVAAGLVAAWRGRRWQSSERRVLAGLVVANGLVYLWIPLDFGYLSPALVSIAAVLALGLPRPAVVALACVNLASWAVTVSVGDHRANSQFFEWSFERDCTPRPPLAHLDSWAPRVAPGHARQFLDTRWVGSCWPPAKDVPMSGPLRLASD